MASTHWPVLRWETCTWAPLIGSAGRSRTLARRHAGPYEAAIPPFIAERTVTVASAVQAAAADAVAEIARFDAELGHEIAPFSAVLLRTESAASSRIERVTASARALAEAEAGLRATGNAVDVVGNVRAMEAAIALAGDISEAAIIDMHAAIVANAGTAHGDWRGEQVWIGGSTLGPHDADFVPPHHRRVPALMTDLVAFVQRADVPTLVHAALAHAQFETIHPFTDGNGRTGRALVHAMLVAAGATRNITVPVSAGLLAATDAYVEALTSFRAGDPEPIIEAFVAASFRATDNGRQLVEELREVRQSWADVVALKSGGQRAAVADLLMRQPVVTAPVVAHALGIATANVYRLMEPFEAADAVVVSGSGRRRQWRAPQVLAAIDAFAQRAGRRG